MHEPRPHPGKHPAFRDLQRQLAKVMTAEDAALVPYLFDDAYVIDLDFSAWQQLVALYLTADFAAEQRSYYPYIFLVEFVRVRQWDITFNHLGRETAGEAQEAGHFYWRIGHYAAQPGKDGMQFTFWGEEDHPGITIVCEGVRIRELPRHIIEQIRPNWQARQTFIRPSLDQLARELDR